MMQNNLTSISTTTTTPPITEEETTTSTISTPTIKRYSNHKKQPVSLDSNNRTSLVVTGPRSFRERKLRENVESTSSQSNISSHHNNNNTITTPRQLRLRAELGLFTPVTKKKSVNHGTMNIPKAWEKLLAIHQISTHDEQKKPIPSSTTTTTITTSTPHPTITLETTKLQSVPPVLPSPISPPSSSSPTLIVSGNEDGGSSPNNRPRFAVDSNKKQDYNSTTSTTTSPSLQSHRKLLTSTGSREERERATSYDLDSDELAEIELLEKLWPTIKDSAMTQSLKNITRELYSTSRLLIDAREDAIRTAQALDEAISKARQFES
jgi:hypothetical protein